MSNKLFKGMRQAKAIERPPYMVAGHTYKLKLQKTYAFETREFGDAFIAEFEILETSSEQRVGTTVSYFQGVSKNKDTAFGALKRLMYALLNLDFKDPEDAKMIENEVDPAIEDEMSKACEENHMKGVVLYAHCFKALSKEKKEYTNISWKPEKSGGK